MVHQRRTIQVATRADILFLVDDSPSMAAKIDRMAGAFARFVASLDALDPPVDYQLAVTTMSVAERFGGCAPADGRISATCESDWYAKGFVCDAGGACLRSFDDRAGMLYAAFGNPSVLRKGDRPPSQLAIALGENLHVPLDGARQTRAYEALQRTVAKNPALLRSGAKLVVLFVTDGDDCSDPSHHTVGLLHDPVDGHILDHCVAEAALPEGQSALMPLSEILSWTQGLSREVLFAGVLDLANGSAQPGICSSITCESDCDTPSRQQQCVAQCSWASNTTQCQSDCRVQCHAWCSGEQPSVRYGRLLNATGGIASSICADDYGPVLAGVARVVGIPSALTLIASPAPTESLLVQVERGGQTINCVAGSDYTASADSIELAPSGPCRLLPGDTYDVRYLTSP